MDKRDEQDGGLVHEALTGAIIGCAFDVINELGAGYLESVYEKAMLIALRQRGLAAQPQQPLTVHFRGECVGEFLADIVVEQKVVVELKVAKSLAPEHEAQLVNYLHATGFEVGLLVNFGNQKLEFRRYNRRRGGKT